MLLEHADKILKEDREEIENYISASKKNEDYQMFIKIATKSSELADFYYDVIENFNERYFQYKLISAEYYEKLSKTCPIQELRYNSKFLSILLYIQAGKKEYAQKLLKNFKIQLQNQKPKEVKHEWLFIIELILIEEYEDALYQLKKLKSEMDESVFTIFKKTIEYAKEMKN